MGPKREGWGYRTQRRCGALLPSLLPTGYPGPGGGLACSPTPRPIRVVEHGKLPLDLRGACAVGSSQGWVGQRKLQTAPQALIGLGVEKYAKPPLLFPPPCEQHVVLQSSACSSQGRRRLHVPPIGLGVGERAGPLPWRGYLVGRGGNNCLCIRPSRLGPTPSGVAQGYFKKFWSGSRAEIVAHPCDTLC